MAYLEKVNVCDAQALGDSGQGLDWAGPDRRTLPVLARHAGALQLQLLCGQRSRVSRHAGVVCEAHRPSSTIP